MKLVCKIILAVWTFTVGSSVCQSADQFQNLTFESPMLPFVPNDPLGFGRVPISQALPGWSAYLDNNPLGLITYNGLALSSANISLFGPPPGPVQLPESIIEGQYTAFLQSGHGLGSAVSETYSSSLAQIGLVPLSTASVQMKVRSIGPFSVFLGGQELDMVSLQQGPNYTLYGGNALGFAGQVAELRITCDLYFSPTIGGFSAMYLDSITFSPQVVPEPSTWVLLGLGVLVAGFARRRTLVQKGCKRG